MSENLLKLMHTCHATMSWRTSALLSDWLIRIGTSSGLRGFATNVCFRGMQIKRFKASRLTLNSMAVSKAIFASLLTCMASDWALVALCNAICASRLRWPASFLARVAVFIAIVKLTFACSPKVSACVTSSCNSSLILLISSSLKELLRYKLWKSFPRSDSTCSLRVETSLSCSKEALICAAAR